MVSIIEISANQVLLLLLVLELRFGYYKEEVKVAISNRHKADDIIKYVEE